MDLQPTDKANLLAIIHTQGYATLIKIMERLCEESKNILLETDPSDSAKIVAAHNIALAYRAFFNDLLKIVNTNTEIEKPVEQLSQMDILRKM